MFCAPFTDFVYIRSMHNFLLCWELPAVRQGMLADVNNGKTPRNGTVGKEGIFTLPDGLIAYKGLNQAILHPKYNTCRGT